MNQDHNQRFPEQDIENRPQECVGETVSDLIGNLAQIPCDAGYSYATALKVMNQSPTTAGSDPYSGMLGGMIYGALPTDKVPFDVNVMDELYESNINNYPLEEQELAQFYAQNGVKIFNSYQEIVSWLSLNKGGVSLALKWYASFSSPPTSGVLPEPQGQFTYHNVAVYESTTSGLRVKPWLGPRFGDAGYCYLTEETFDTVWFGAYAFDPTAWRWLSLAYAGVARWYLLKDIVPMMKKRV